MGVEFRLLGPLEAMLDGRPLALGGPKQRALLALLLLHRERGRAGRARARCDLAAMPTRLQRHGACRCTSRRFARRLAARPARSRPEREATRSPSELTHLDALRFERLAAEGRQALRGWGGSARRRCSFERRSHSGAGSRSPTSATRSFAQSAVARLEELRLTTLEERIEADLALGRHVELVARARGARRGAASARAPAPPAHARAVPVGPSGRCARSVPGCPAHADDELGLDPGPELRELELAILRHDARSTSSPHELQARRRLPAPATALVGRRRGVDEVAALLAGGPSRHADRSGRNRQDPDRDPGCARARGRLSCTGSCFVGLAALRDAELVVPEIALALGVQSGTRSAAESLAEHRPGTDAAPARRQLRAGRRRRTGARRAARRRAGPSSARDQPSPAPSLRRARRSPCRRSSRRRRSPSSSRARGRSDAASSPLPSVAAALPAPRSPAARDRARRRSRAGALARTSAGRPAAAPRAGRGRPPRRARPAADALGDDRLELRAARRRVARTLFARMAVFEGGCAVDAAARRLRCRSGARPEPRRQEPSSTRTDERADDARDGPRVRARAPRRATMSGGRSPASRRALPRARPRRNRAARRCCASGEWMDRLEADRENVRAAFGFWLEHDAEQCRAPGRRRLPLLVHARVTSTRASAPSSGSSSSASF